MSGKNDEWQRRLRAVGAKIEQGLDQRLAEVRGEYAPLKPDQQRELRAWVQRLADLNPPQLSAHVVTARVEFLVPKGEDTDAVRVSVGALLRAIDAWDKGEDFAPKALRDM